MTILAQPTTFSLWEPERLLTVADVAALPSSLPSGDVRYELDNGRLVVMPPPGDIHGAGQSNITTHLKVQGEWKGHGKARSEVGVILRRSPDRLVGPDALFVCNDRLPIRLSPEGYLETIPDLIVEVRSKNDAPAEVVRKVEEYLRAGVRVVWVLDHAAKAITVFRLGRQQLLGESDTLTADDIIPGFQVPVKDLLVT